MTTGRLEAFSDGVIAIIITIMVLELRTPLGPRFQDLRELGPDALSYLLSFAILGIYWNNHHHLLQAAKTVNGAILWANLHLLFWLSLIPFATRWMGTTKFAMAPVALYGMILLAAGCAYYVLVRTLLAHHGPESKLAEAIGADWKGKASLGIYAIAVALAFVLPWGALALYGVVTIMWLIPDRRIEHVLAR
jgi:uncharacterized membrane protein